MAKRRAIIAAAGGLACFGPVALAVEVGQQAPEFTAPAVLAGRVFSFSLSANLRHGPVVLYFFPAAFSEGCSIEARAFADAIDSFKALGATAVGVSGGGLDMLSRFSVKVCNGKFALVSDESQVIMTSYAAVMQTRPDFASRTSFVIAPDGSVLLVYGNLSPHDHVTRTLAALRAWSQARRP